MFALVVTYGVDLRFDPDGLGGGLVAWKEDARGIRRFLAAGLIPEKTDMLPPVRPRPGRSGYNRGR